MDNKKSRSEAPQRARVFIAASSEFEDVVKANGFVDNTELLYIFLETEERRVELITAPPRFGKSTNLTMFRCFCEIEVDAKSGALKTHQDPLTEAVTDTKNYLIFVNNRLEILKYEDIVANHFGRHPVLYVNFSCDQDMKTVEDANKFCRKVAHDAFDDHQYLCQSEELNAAEREYCQDWCHPKKYKISDPSYALDPTDALEQLHMYLYKHFTRDVLFLVDEYDSIVSRALFDSNENNLETICRKPLDMMSLILKRNNKKIHLLGALVTGMSYIAGIAWSNSVNLLVHRKFCIGHEFTRFYGLQGKQVDDLLLKLNQVINFKLDQEARKVIRNHYNGYEFLGDDQDNDKKVYCTWSVMSYLQEGKVAWYWRGYCFIQPLMKMFSNDGIRQSLVTLLDSKSCPLDLSLMLSVDHLKLLRQLMQGDVEEAEIDFFLNFLLELGYLTFDSDTYPRTHVKIPNVEVRILFLDILRRHYSKKCKTEFKTEVNASKPLFNELFTVVKPNVSDESFENAVEKFRDKLEELFVLYARDCLIGPDVVNEPSLHCFMTYLLSLVGFEYSPELYVPKTKGYLDVVGIKEDFGLLLKFKYDIRLGCSAHSGLRQAVKKKYNSILEELGAENHIIMGVSVNNRNKMAISCIRNYKSGGQNTEHHIEYKNPLLSIC